MRKHMFGLMGALGVMAMFGAAVAADRLAEPFEVFGVNPAVMRVNVGETDRASGMTDYFVVREGPASVAPAMLRIKTGETDLAAGEPKYTFVELPATLPLVIQKQIDRIGETDLAAGLGLEPLSPVILREIERVFDL